ncbi:MAG: hypothetical protein ACRDIE_25985 [Chloroflexota bacterium]
MTPSSPPGPARRAARPLLTWIKLIAALILAAILAVLMLGSSAPNSIPVAPAAVTATPPDDLTPIALPATPTVDRRSPTPVLPPDTYIPGHIYYVQGQAIYSVHHNEAPQLITTGSEPALSPDGKQLAFILFSKNYQDLWLLNLKTHTLTRLLDDALTDWQNASTGLTAAMPAWSADGQSVLFSWSYPGAPIAGTNNFDRTDFSITRCLAVGPCNTNTAVKLTTPAFQSGGDYDAAPRPGDPTVMVYARYLYETARDNTSRSLAYLVALNPTTLSAIQLTPFLDNDSQPTWSPDGKYLLYMKTSDDMRQTSIWEMAFHPPGDLQDNANAHLLISGSPFAADPAFSPDGKDLAYLATGDDGRLHLYIAQIHLGTNPRIDHVQEVRRAGIVDGDRVIWGH